MGKYGDPPKDVSELTYSEVIDQLQILEYVELNKPSEYDEECRRSQKELEERQQQLERDGSLDPKLEDLEKALAERQAKESHDLSLKQAAELNRLGPSQQLTDRHRQEWEKRSRDFVNERDRYIKEFLDSERMRNEARDEEARKGREPGQEREL